MIRSIEAERLLRHTDWLRELAYSIVETVERVTAQRALVDAVLALEGLDRDVVVLRYFEGLPPRRIARQLEMSSAAVRSRLSRALAKLRVRLADERGLDARALALVAARSPGDTSALVPLFGGLLVNTTVKLALAAGALLAALVYVGVWGDAPNPPPSTMPATGPSAGRTPLDPIRADSPKNSSEDDAPRAVDIEGRNSAALSVAQAEEEPAPAETREHVVVQARIVDGTGEPLEGAELTAVDLREPVSAKSGADGRVRLEIPWPMELARGNEHWAFVEASLPGWTRARHQERLLGPSLLEIGDLRLEPGGDVAGRVIDASGAPVSDAYVYVVGGALPGAAELEEERRVRGWPFPSVGMTPHSTQTEEDGTYRIEGVPARAISIVARRGGMYVAYTPPLDVPAGREAKAPDVVLHPVEAKNTIRGIVVDAQGPVPGAEVSAYENRGPRNIDPQAGPTHTEEDGRFELVVLSDSVHTLQVTHPRTRGLEVLTHDVRAGDLGVRVVFPERRTIRVDVVDRDGEPIDGVALGLFEHPSRFGLRTSQEPHPEGGALLALPTMTFGVSVTAAGYLPRTVGPYDPATAPDPLVVELTRAGALRGRVTADGSPVAGTRVHAHGPPRWSTIERFDDGLYTRWDSHDGRPPTVETGSNGRFELFLAGDGPFLLHAEAEGFTRAEAGPFDRAAGESQGDIDVRLTSGATLVGRVRVAEGVPVEGTIVAITHADGHVDSTVVGDDGSYLFERLTPGAWQVRRGTAWNQEWLRVARTYPVYDEDVEIPVDVELRDGVTTTYDLDFSHEVPCTVSGWLALDGAWESGWSASIGSREHRTSGTVSPDGAYKLTILGPGEAWMHFFSSTPTGGMTQLTSAALSLQPGANGVDWSASTGTVELTDLPPPEPTDDEVRSPGYALVRVDDDGWTWSSTFDPDGDGRRTCERVPAGTVELRSRRSPDDMNPKQWPAIGAFDVTGRQRVTFALPRDR